MIIIVAYNEKYQKILYCTILFCLSWVLCFFHMKLGSVLSMSVKNFLRF